MINTNTETEMGSNDMLQIKNQKQKKKYDE